MNKLIIQINIFFILLTAGSVYINIFGGEFFYLFILLTSFYLIFKNPIFNRSIFNSLLFSTTVTVFLIILNWLITGLNFSYSIYPKIVFRLIVINLGIFALVNSRQIHFNLNSFSNSFKIITFHALINFILGFFISDKLFSVSTSDFGVDTFYYLFFYLSTFKVGSVTIFRNQGIFWEPGVLAVFLNIYFFILLFQYRSSIILRILVSFLIISTFSTTGILTMSLMILFFFITDGFKLANVPFFIISILILLPIIINNISDKFSGENEKSFLSRSYDTMVAIDIIKSNPFTGIGLSMDHYLIEQEKYPTFKSSDINEPRGSTNSILYTLVSLGIPLSLILFFLLANQKLIYKKKYIFFVIMIILLSSEPLILSGFILFFICSYFYSKDAFI